MEMVEDGERMSREKNENWIDQKARSGRRGKGMDRDGTAAVVNETRQVFSVKRSVKKKRSKGSEAKRGRYGTGRR